MRRWRWVMVQVMPDAETERWLRRKGIRCFQDPVPWTVERWAPTITPVDYTEPLP